jgi:uncharacterized protein YjbI with pentapeptide repeats
MPTPTASEMLDSVRTEAVELRSFTITFLSLLIYLSLIVVATDHEQILRVDPVTLPLLDVKIPIVGFYQFMPPFLFFMHLYLLVQHYLFSQLAFKFEEALHRETPDMQKDIRHRLGNLPFMHWLLGKNGTIIQLIMVFISLISLVIWPLFMFWWMQARFLPYHDEGIVFWQQSWLSIDVLMLAYLWAKILDKNNSVLHWWRQLTELGSGLRRLCADEWYYTQQHWSEWRIAISSRPKWAWLGEWLKTGWQVMHHPHHRLQMQVGLGNMWNGFVRLLMALLLLTALSFSWLVSITRDSGQEKRWLTVLLSIDSKNAPNYWLLTDINTSFFFSIPVTTPHLVFKPTAWLHEKKRIKIPIFDEQQQLNEQQFMEYDPARVTRINCNSDDNTSEQNSRKKLPDNDENQTDSAKKNRCYLVDSLLPRNMILRERLLTADTEVKPELAATLAADQEQVAASELNKINPLDLKGRNFDYADFSESSLPRVDLRRASLKYANLKQVRLDQAQLNMARLDSADLSNAGLVGAHLSGAWLVGSDLLDARLAGADLRRTELEGSELNAARLAGSDLSGAVLAGVDLKGAVLAGAILSDSYRPLTDTNELNKLLKKYRQQLEQEPVYQTPDGKKILEQKVKNLRERVGKAADFTHISLTDAPCLTNDPKLAGEIGCLIWDKANQQDRNKVLNFWTTLACQDDSNGKLAASITARATEKKFPSEDYRWLGLATKLQQAGQNTKACPGLATLSKDLQDELTAAAREQKNAQKSATLAKH